jgi:hypothetical protein
MYMTLADGEPDLKGIQKSLVRVYDLSQGHSKDPGACIRSIEGAYKKAWCVYTILADGEPDLQRPTKEAWSK